VPVRQPRILGSGLLLGSIAENAKKQWAPSSFASLRDTFFLT